MLLLHLLLIVLLVFMLLLLFFLLFVVLVMRLIFYVTHDVDINVFTAVVVTAFVAVVAFCC